jgi:hypothetical protein
MPQFHRSMLVSDLIMLKLWRHVLGLMGIALLLSSSSSVGGTSNWRLQMVRTWTGLFYLGTAFSPSGGLGVVLVTQVSRILVVGMLCSVCMISVQRRGPGTKAVQTE